MRDTPINDTAVADHLMGCFEYAADIIPEEFHMTTSVKYAATAGMRLLDEDEQDEVYDALYRGLMENENFVFSAMQRDDVATLSGELEGFYGAVAANFLVGSTDTSLSKKDDLPLGALDMGGSSTQIVYLPRQKHCESDSCDITAPKPYLHKDDFFSTSYLAYGVDQMRERLWNTLVQDRQEEGNLHENSSSTKIIDNPCTFSGYKIEWKGYTLMGSGNSEECVRQVQRLIPHYEPDADLGGKVGGVEHPEVRGKFFAMSLYFFSLDSLRELSTADKEAHEALNRSWPTPSIEELYNALTGLCSRDWESDLVHIQHNSHTYTRAEVLPHRCFESVYMVTLLRDGFGFRPESRDITFTFLVNGDEVEWSLGLALDMHAENHKSAMEMQRAVEANLTEQECEPKLILS